MPTARAASTRWGLAQDVYRGRRAIGHGGTTAGAKSESMRFPEIDGSVVILANVDAVAPFPLARRIADIAFANALEPQIATGALAGMEGLYREVGGDEVFALEGLAIRSGMGGAPLHETAPGVLAPERVTTNLMLARDGDALRATWCGAPCRYERIAPRAEAPADVAGAYANEAAGLTAEVEGMRLTFRSPYGQHRLRLRPLDRDMLAGLPEDAPETDAWTCVLRRDGDDLVLTTDRTKGLRLRRAA